MIGRCINCSVFFIDADTFAMHQRAHNIVGAPTPTAPLPTTHGMRSVERGTFARLADGLDDPARCHPSAGRRTLRGGAA